MAKDQGARARILEAAGVLFAGRGFEAVSIADIASAAQVSTGLVYYHFEDKRHLFESVMREGLHVLEEVAVRTLVGTEPPAARLESFVFEYMRLAGLQRHLIRLLVRNFSDLQGPAPQNVLMRSMETIDRLESVIDEGIGSGQFRGVDTHLAATALFALVNTIVMARALETPVARAVEGEPEAQARFMADLFLRGISSEP